MDASRACLKGHAVSWNKPLPRPPKQWTADELPGPRVPLQAALRVADTRSRLTITLPKNPPKRSETYRRWVATRPCEHCGKVGATQAAHADEGKGMAMKSDDETCFPLCVTCHTGIGSQGWFKREHRRSLEKRYALQTQMAAKSCGQWPSGW